jgi:hypothetical protein
LSTDHIPTAGFDRQGLEEEVRLLVSRAPVNSCDDLFDHSYLDFCWLDRIDDWRVVVHELVVSVGPRVIAVLRESNSEGHTVRHGLISADKSVAGRREAHNLVEGDNLSFGDRVAAWGAEAAPRLDIVVLGEFLESRTSLPPVAKPEAGIMDCTVYGTKKVEPLMSYSSSKFVLSTVLVHE